MSIEIRPGCARVRAHLTECTRSRRVPEDERDRGHLEGCAPCRRELARHLLVVRAVRRVSRPDRERLELLEAAVMAALPARTPRTRLVVRQRLGWAVAAALLAGAWTVATALDLHPGAVQLPRLDPLTARLPDWSSAVTGLEQLSRWLAGGLQ